MGKINTILWLMLVVVIALALYWPGLNAPYFHDDYQFVFNEPASKILYYFAQPNNKNPFFRPIQCLFLAIIQTCVGMQTWPIHLTQIVVHVALTWLIYVTVVDLGFSKLQAGIGAAFMLLSQANVHPVLSNDTLSQIGGTLFGCLALRLLYRSYRVNIDDTSISNKHRRIDYRYYIISILLLLLSMLFKETATAFPPMAVVVVLVANLRTTRTASGIMKNIVDLIPCALAVGLYMTIRTAVVGAKFNWGGSATYNFNLGFNVIRNLVMLIFALFVPTSTVEAFSAIKSGSLVVITLIVVLTTIFFGLVGVGIWSARKHRVTILMGVFALMGMFPVILLNHVGELYVYNSLPFVAALVGIGLGQLWLTAKSDHTGRGLLVLMFCALIISHIAAVRSKVFLMNNNGRRAMALQARIKPFLDNVPPNGRLCLYNPTARSIRYSIFRMWGFDVLRYSSYNSQLWNRADFEVQIVPQEERLYISPDEDTLVLTLDGDKVVTWPK